jgi:hypothetical protein
VSELDPRPAAAVAELARRGRITERQVLDLAGRWKHGWVPLDATALAVKMKRKPGSGSGGSRRPAGKGRGNIAGTLAASGRKESLGRRKSVGRGKGEAVPQVGQRETPPLALRGSAERKAADRYDAAKRGTSVPKPHVEERHGYSIRVAQDGPIRGAWHAEVAHNLGSGKRDIFHQQSWPTRAQALDSAREVADKQHRAAQRANARDRAKPSSLEGSSLHQTPAQRTARAEAMFGTGSKQHRAAQEMEKRDNAKAAADAKRRAGDAEGAARSAARHAAAPGVGAVARKGDIAIISTEHRPAWVNGQHGDRPNEHRHGVYVVHKTDASGRVTHVRRLGENSGTRDVNGLHVGALGRPQVTVADQSKINMDSLEAASREQLGPNTRSHHEYFRSADDARSFVKSHQGTTPAREVAVPKGLVVRKLDGGRGWQVQHEESGAGVHVQVPTKQRAEDIATHLGRTGVDWTKPAHQLRQEFTQHPEVRAITSDGFAGRLPTPRVQASAKAAPDLSGHSTTTLHSMAQGASPETKARVAAELRSRGIDPAAVQQKRNARARERQGAEDWTVFAAQHRGKAPSEIRGELEKLSTARLERMADGLAKDNPRLSAAIRSILSIRKERG